MDRPLSKTLLLYLGVVVVLVLANAAADLRDTRALHDESARVAQSHGVQAELGTLLGSVTDAEAGQRGFIITGDSGYLAPYLAALASIGHEFDSLMVLVAGNPAQQERLGRLQGLVNGKLDELAATAAVRRISVDSARAQIMTHLGRNRMDAIRTLVGTMLRDEQTTLAARQVANDRAYRNALVTSAVATVIALMALIGFAGLVRQQMKTRIAAHAVLHQQREWFRTTLASIGDAVIVTDAEGVVNFLNPVAEELTGWTLAEAAGKPLDEVFLLVSEVTRAPVENPALRALREGKIVGLANHSVLVTKGGGETAIDDSAAPIRDEEGRMSGAVLVFRDVGARRRAERELADADRRKDEFIATVSHELRNPLAALRSAVELGKLAGDDAALQVTSRGIIERQVAQIVRLVDDLLDISRITSGRLRLRNERVMLAQVLQLALEEARPGIHASGHELDLQLTSQPIYIDGDSARLAQVFTNLLNNAAKYTERGGTISLATELDDGHAVVSVRDTGIGIDPAHLTRIFEMYSQVESANGRSQGGLGIGLALVRGLVELHDGKVHARSDGAGKGSEFVVRLPVADGRPSTGRVDSGDGRPGGDQQTLQRETPAGPS